jgi:hypothetical protein
MGEDMKIRNVMRCIMLMGLATLLLLPSGAKAENDRHAGYYYPPITSRETYKARAVVMPEADSDMRLNFITGLAFQQNQRPYPPSFVMFAKGERFERLIIVGIGSNGFRGIYQARAVLAQMTSIARTSPIFRENNVQDLLTFLDLARMLGFEELTVSDGQSFAHRIALK